MGLSRPAALPTKLMFEPVTRRVGDGLRTGVKGEKGEEPEPPVVDNDDADREECGRGEVKDEDEGMESESGVLRAADEEAAEKGEEKEAFMGVSKAAPGVSSPWEKTTDFSLLGTWCDSASPGTVGGSFRCSSTQKKEAFLGRPYRHLAYDTTHLKMRT